ncbi:hypothetical protein JCM8097_009094 [Rhodosporidiobolus ruineniae]
MDRQKRSRSLSESSSSSFNYSEPLSPSSKAFRSSSPPSARYTCTLPPSCHNSPYTFSSLDALDAHHRNYHAHVCTAPPPTFEWAVSRADQKRKGKERMEEGEGGRGMVCGRVFPDERLLQLHLTECHDELAQLRRERGEKIFACFLPTCSHHTSTPKSRRLHLIDKHAYPKQYFFGVTIWGVEDVLEKGGGMVRRDWKPRPGQPGYGSDDGEKEPSPPMVPRKQLPTRSSSPPPPPSKPSPDVDDLTLAFAGTSISLVPRSVRLAGAKKGKMAVDK